MSYFKCKDCDYFEKGFLVYNGCNNPHNSSCTAVGYSSPCEYFETSQYNCGDCARYKENGKCNGKSGKRFSNHPACEFYKPASGDCFLTTACVEYLGKADDCAELTALRSFRDGYLKSADGGEELINKYYEIAPAILEGIKKSGKESEYFGYIYGVIERCVKLLEKCDYESTLTEYKNMVLKLKSQLL